MAAINMYGLMKGTDRAFHIVLIVSNRRNNPHLGFFKKDNFPNLIVMVPEKSDKSFSYAEENLVSVCHKETLMDVIQHCKEVTGVLSNPLEECI